MADLVEQLIVTAFGVALTAIAGFVVWKLRSRSVSKKRTTPRVRPEVVFVPQRETKVIEKPVILPAPSPSYEQAEDQGSEELLFDETAVVEPDDHIIYDMNLPEGSLVAGEVSSDDSFNAYFLSPSSLRSFEEGYEFREADGTGGVTRYRINFIPPRGGKWHLVIENEGADNIEVDVKLAVS